VRDLVLVRHAIAENRDPEAWPDDSLRPLTPRGEERFRGAARGLRRVVPVVDAVLASPFERAWRTAELLRAEAGWPAPERCPALEAHREPGDAAELLSERNEASLALVGHEPHLSLLASLLMTGDTTSARLELRKGGALLLRFADRCESGRAVLRWHLTPKILRSLAG
jgi:phosphohistidine phosphatase